MIGEDNLLDEKFLKYLKIEKKFKKEKDLNTKKLVVIEKKENKIKKKNFKEANEGENVKKEKSKFSDRLKRISNFYQNEILSTNLKKKNKKSSKKINIKKKDLLKDNKKKEDEKDKNFEDFIKRNQYWVFNKNKKNRILKNYHLLKKNENCTFTPIISKIKPKKINNEDFFSFAPKKKEEPKIIKKKKLYSQIHKNILKKKKN